MFNTLKIHQQIHCAETFKCLIGKETKDLDRDTVHTIWSISGIFPGGGGGGGGMALRYRGGGGGTRVTYFAEEGVFFKTSACPSFCKSRVLFKQGISVISLCSIVLYSAIFYVVYLYHYVLRQSQ